MVECDVTTAPHYPSIANTNHGTDEGKAFRRGISISLVSSFFAQVLCIGHSTRFPYSGDMREATVFPIYQLALRGIRKLYTNHTYHSYYISLN